MEWPVTVRYEAISEDHIFISAPTGVYNVQILYHNMMAFPGHIGYLARSPVSCIRGSTHAPDQLQLSLRPWLNHTLERLGVASEKLPRISWLPLNSKVKNRNHNAPNRRFVILRFDCLTCRWLYIEHGEGTRYVEEHSSEPEVFSGTHSAKDGVERSFRH